MASGRQHIICTSFTFNSWPALTNWEDKVNKTLHRCDLGCTSTFLTLTVMLNSRRLTFLQDSVTSPRQLWLELSQMKSALHFVTCGGQKNILGRVERNGYDFLVFEMSHLENIISIILLDTFAYNLLFSASFCGGPFPFPGLRRKAVYFLVIFGWKGTLNLETNFLHFKDSLHARCITMLSRWWEPFQTVSQSWKYQNDLMSSTTCHRLMWRGSEHDLFYSLP